MNRELRHDISLRALPRCWVLLIVAVLALVTAGCGSSSADATRSDPCADVVAARILGDPAEAVTIEVTVRSADVGWEGYADRWEVLADGELVAERILLHPHVDEQPFTRSVGGVVLPGEISILTIRAHHSVGGFCGEPYELVV